MCVCVDMEVRAPPKWELGHVRLEYGAMRLSTSSPFIFMTMRAYFCGAEHIFGVSLPAYVSCGGCANIPGVMTQAVPIVVKSW